MVSFGDRETADKVPAHIEHCIPDILGVENSGADAHGPLWAGTPGNPQSRREVSVAGIDQPAAQEAVRPRNREVRVEADRHILIEIARPGADEYRLKVGIR